MASSCDLCMCGKGAALGLAETGLIAIIPVADGMQRFPRLFGRSVAKELIFTGLKNGGKEAMSMGLVNYFVPAGEARLKALEVAQEINQKGPIAIRMARRAINEGIQMDLASALELEEECYERTLNTKDRFEGVEHLLKRRNQYIQGNKPNNNDTE